MPPKSVSATVPPRRPFPTTPLNSIHNFDSTSTVHYPPSSTTAAAMTHIPSLSTAVTASPESAQRIRPIHESNSESIIRIPPHATTPTSQSQSQSSHKTLTLNSGQVNSDGNNYCEPEKLTGSSNSGSSVEPVAKESAANVVAGSGNGKRKVMRKTVILVKKIVKKRVPKRSRSENQGVAVKAEDGINLSKVRDNLDPTNEVIGKSNVVDEVVEKTSVVNEANEVLSMTNDVVDEVVEKTSVVNEANEVLSMTNDVTEDSNLVNEKSDHVDRVTEKTSIIDEVMEKENITLHELEIGNATNVFEPIIGKESKGPSGIAYMELDRSKLEFIANSFEKTVPLNELRGVNTVDTDNIENNGVVSEVDGSDLTIRAPDLMEVEIVNNVSETCLKTKEIENSKTENQSENLIVETEKIGIADKVDVEILSGQNVGPVGEKVERTIGKAESGSEVDSDRKGLSLTGETLAVERKKRSKTEIFIGGLNKDTQEDDIRKVFGEAGLIEEIRLVMSNSGKNRGYAFVRFAIAADAKNALEKYSKVEICGKQCNVEPVEGNDTLFLSNIDRNWKAEDVVTLLEKARIEKIDKVTLKPDPDNIEKNRGFAFVEFQTCKDAQSAFNKLQKKDILGKNLMVKAAWAEPLSVPTEEETLQVKSVFAEYLPSSWDRENVKDYFKRFGEIESVALAKDLASSKRKDFAFINYTTRDAALACIDAVNREKSEDGFSKVKMAACLAKPVLKRKKMKRTSDLSSKQLHEAKQKAFETSRKQHEPRNQGKPARSSYNHVKVDERSSTTDELVQILRQQASNKHILSHPRTGINIPDHHFLLPGSKRSLSLSGHDRHQDFSRLRVESSYPISVPSASSHGVHMLSFPSHHQQVPGFTTESVDQRRMHPSHFQTREHARYYADNNMHRRCE